MMGVVPCEGVSACGWLCGSVSFHLPASALDGVVHRRSGGWRVPRWLLWVRPPSAVELVADGSAARRSVRRAGEAQRRMAAPQRRDAGR